MQALWNQLLSLQICARGSSGEDTYGILYLNKCNQAPRTFISGMLSWVANIYFSLLIKEKTHSV